MVAKKIISKKGKVYLNHLMDEVVQRQLSKEEYPIPAPKNVRKNIALVETPDKKHSINTMRTRFSVQILNILQILAKLRNFFNLF